MEDLEWAKFGIFPLSMAELELLLEASDEDYEDIASNFLCNAYCKLENGQIHKAYEIMNSMFGERNDWGVYACTKHKCQIDDDNINYKEVLKTEVFYPSDQTYNSKQYYDFLEDEKKKGFVIVRPTRREDSSSGDDEDIEDDIMQKEVADDKGEFRSVSVHQQFLFNQY